MPETGGKIHFQFVPQSSPLVEVYPNAAVRTVNTSKISEEGRNEKVLPGSAE